MGYAKKPPGCIGCPAYKHGVGFVPPEGPPDADLALIGQGPGQQEAFNSRPFFDLAPIGERLNKWLNRSGIPRRSVLIGNVVQCWLPEYYRSGVPDGNRDPSRPEIQWCWNAHVGPWLHGLRAGGRVLDLPEGQVPLPLLISIGFPATRFLMNLPHDGPVDKYTGTVNLTEIPPLGVNHVPDPEPPADATDAAGDQTGPDSAPSTVH